MGTIHPATVEDLYRLGDRAEAEPASPGWSMPVEDFTPR
jgi:hypothetical protein